MKRIMFIILVGVLLSVPALGMSKERRGAEVKIKIQDGRVVRGELITVKPDSLLILDRYSGSDMSVDLRDVREVFIVKKSKFWTSAGLGLLIGGASGVLLGYALGDDPEPTHSQGIFSYNFSISLSSDQKALGLGIFLGLIGMIAGGFAGADAGTDQPVLLNDSSRLLLELNLEKLRSQARIPDFK